MRVWSYVDEVARAGSLRRAAERLHVTASAVQRRIEDIEHDLGAALFERSAAGMRLTTAGELFLQWIRSQAAELERVQSQIQDLTGLRRGHIRITCSQALALSFLPGEIAAFRRDAPDVTFDVMIRDHEAAIAALAAFEADLALVFRPDHNAVWQPIASLRQPLVAIMSASHPLASQDRIRLRDCSAYPVALPHEDYGTRQVLETCLAGRSAQFNIVLVSDSFELLRNFCREGDAITFQIGIGAPAPGDDPRLVCRPVDDREGAHGSLVLGQLRGRTLPVAAAKFADQLAKRLDEAAGEAACYLREGRS